MSKNIIKRLKNLLKAQARYIKDDNMIDVYEKVDGMNIIEDLMNVLEQHEKVYTEEEMKRIEIEEMGYIER